MDIETLHQQLLEAAAAVDADVQPSLDMWSRGLHSGGYINISRFEKPSIDTQQGEHIPVILLPDNIVPSGEGMSQLERLLRSDTSFSTMPVSNRTISKEVSFRGDVNLAFAKSHAVEYRPASSANHATAIPSICSLWDTRHDYIMHGDKSEVPLDSKVSCWSAPSDTDHTLLSRRSPSKASPLTPPLRAIQSHRSESEDHKSAPQMHKLRTRANEKAKEAMLASPSANKSRSRTKGSAPALGAYPCTEEGCIKVCRRRGDLNRHQHTLAHQSPSFACPSGCGKMFSRKDAAKRHSECDKCSLFTLA
jgi:hypothetical protein